MRMAMKYMKLSHIEYTYGCEVYEIESYMKYTHGYRAWPYIGSYIRVIHISICS